MGILFPILSFALASLFFAGILVFVRRWRHNRRRVLREDALKQVSSASLEGRSITQAELAGLLDVSSGSALRLIQELESANLLRSRAAVLELTENGRRKGLEILRSHRLMERFFYDEAHLPLDRLHSDAEQAEHYLKNDELDVLADHLGHPTIDPHGDLIPRSTGEFEVQSWTRLSDWPCDQPAMVVHIEDEPQEALGEAIRAGLLPGMVVRVVKRNADAIMCVSSTGSFNLSPAVAAKVDVRAAVDGEVNRTAHSTLAELPLGQEATVVALSDRCAGLRRRRLLDLGFTEGAKIRAVLTNVGDEAHAYLIRDTLVALRDQDAAQVIIRPLKSRDAIDEPQERAAP